MKIGFASGRLNGTKQQPEEQAKELLIMDGASYIKKGKPIYATIRRTIWEIVKIA